MSGRPLVTTKRVGRDCELSTTGVTADGRTVPPWEVTRDVLDRIETALLPVGGRVWRSVEADEPRAASRERWWSVDANGQSSDNGSAYGAESIDTLRHWTSSGQCFYSDMSHVEAAGAETADPFGLTAQSLSVLRVCEAARRVAEEEAPTERTYALTTANVDFVDPRISWGSHYNVAVTPALWRELFRYPRDRVKLGYVTSVLAALVPFFGCGYVIPFRSGPRFSLSARAHHVNRLSTLPTTEAFRRGILNERREGHSSAEERLHLICFDFALAGSALLTSMVQSALAAAELDEAETLLDDPVRALKMWSYGLDPATGRLTLRAATADGGGVELPAFVRRVATRLLSLVERGVIAPDVAPHADQLLPRVIDLTRYLEEGSIELCAPHLDWAAKLLVLTDLSLREGLALDDPRMRLADHDYASTDPERGHFWRLWEEGRVDPLVSAGDVDAALVDGPDDGRGWGRGRLVRVFGDRIKAMDWSHVDLAADERPTAERVRVHMPSTGSHSKAAFEPVLRDAIQSGRIRDLCAQGAGIAGPGRRP